MLMTITAKQNLVGCTRTILIGCGKALPIAP